MSSTYSTNLGIELMATGENADTWGAVTNTNLGTLLEQAISGYVTQAVSTGFDTTITIPDGSSGVARNMYIELTGTGGAATNLIVPAKKKLYFIYNNTASGQVTVKVSGQSGVSVANGDKVILVCNGTDVVTATAYKEGTVTSVAGTGTVNGITLTGTVTSSGNLTLGGALSGVNLASQVTGTLPYNNGGTGQTSYTNGQLLIGNTSTGGLNKATLTAGSNITITNGNGTIEIAATNSGGTVTAVTASSPLASTGGTTPVISLSGTVGLSNGGTGAATAANARVNLLPSYTGNASKVLALNSGATDVEWIAAAGGTGNITFSTNTISTSGTNQDMLLVPNGTGRVYINGLQVGPGKGSSNTNAVFGNTAGNSLTSGTYNVTVGYAAGNQITSGSENITIGYAGDVNLRTTNANVLIGHFAGSYTNGSNNTAVGRTALALGLGGNSNTAIGSSALTNSGSYSNATGLGAGTDVTGNDQVQLGSSSTTTYAYGAVQNRSDARDKADIQDTDLGLNFIMALRPRKFKWDMREDYKPPMPDINTATPEQMQAWQEACNLSNITHDGSKTRNRYHQGLIAQEVKSTMDAMGIDFGGYQDHSINGGQDVKSIGYNELVAPLIKAIQELKTEFDEYKRTHP